MDSIKKGAFHAMNSGFGVINANYFDLNVRNYFGDFDFTSVTN
ncbi:MAG: hypothetical protein ABI472_20365 [Ginsengibacter sp.]